MTVTQLLSRLSDQGISVSLVGMDLRFRGPTEVITPGLKEELRQRKTELVESLIPKRDGTPLQRLAYEVRDKKLISERRTNAVELQTFLSDHVDEHMNTEPFGLPEWISAIEEFNVVERGHLREVFHYTGCIHDSGRCPDDAQVVCTTCEDHTQPYD